MPVVDARLAPHARGVDEADRAVVGLDHRVDGVAGGAGQVVHDGALLADEPVEQRRLADVGAADDGDREHLVGQRPPASAARSSSASLGREVLDDRVEQVAGRPAVQRAHRVRVAEAERQELPRRALVAGVVDLVGHEQRRAVSRRRTAAARSSSSVTPTTASTTNSTTSASRIARSLWALTLASSASPDGQPAAGVDEQEAPAVPVGLDLLAVAGDARAAPRRSPRAGRRCG